MTTLSITAGPYTFRARLEEGAAEGARPRGERLRQVIQGPALGELPDPLGPAEAIQSAHRARPGPGAPVQTRARSDSGQLLR